MDLRDSGVGYRVNRWIKGVQEMDAGQTGGSKGLRRWIQGKQIDQRDSGVGYRVVRGFKGVQEMDLGGSGGRKWLKRRRVSISDYKLKIVC